MEMTWDNEVASLAQQWAQKCNTDGNGWATHGGTELPDGQRVGQNLAWGDSEDLPRKIKGWVKEKEMYNVGTGRCDQNWKKCGHYSQMVWHSTNKIGCGVANCPGLGWYLVCDYYPAGNTQVKPGVIKPPASLGPPCSGCNLDPGTACNNGLCKPCNPSRDRSCKKYDTAGCKDRTDQSHMRGKCEQAKNWGTCKTWKVEEYCAKSCGFCRS